MKQLNIILCISFLLSNYHENDSWCGTINQQHRDFERMEYAYPEYIDSEHFRVHFTSEAADSFYWNDSWMTHQSNIVYATTLLNQAEYAYLVYENDGWEMPPVDCDDSITDILDSDHCNNYGGNSLYDIYIGLVQGPAAAVVPENPISTSPYIGGFSSFMLFGSGLGLYGSNDDLASFNYYIVAHELHHSIQFSYGSYITGSPGNYVFHSWMLEQTATFMENVVYPNAMHLRLLLSNCNIENPLTYPQAGIYQSYSGALWQNFLVDYLDDEMLIRNVWESYGNRITNGDNPITFFDIFNDEIISSSNNLYNLESMYREYAIWRYFTGDRAIPNQYFDQANLYCTSATLQFPINNTQLQTELGGNRYIEVPNVNLLVNIQADSTIIIPSLLMGIENNGNVIFSDLELMQGANFINIDNEFDGNHILILLSGYTGNELNFETLMISIDINTSSSLGDIDGNGIINIIDVIQLINYILDNNYQLSADINNDGDINVIDVVLLVDLILN
jgi:hypothetical protein